jgi:hypothetical protein
MSASEPPVEAFWRAIATLKSVKDRDHTGKSRTEITQERGEPRRWTAKNRGR